MKRAFYILAIFYLLAVAFQLLVSLYINGFHFAYPLDDPYIHLAIAKNLSNYGVWGLTQFAFNSSSSSLLFTILIAVFNFIIPIGVYIPLLINLIGGIFLLYIIMKISIKEQYSIKAYYLISLIMILLLPMIALSISGMEHILHISFILVLVYYVSYIFEKNKITFKEYIFIFFIATISISLRYETIFILFAIGVLLLIKKRFKDILIITILPLFPIVIFGFISLEKGWYFLPNTLMMKGVSPALNLIAILKLSYFWIERAVHYPHIISSFIVLFISIYYLGKKKRKLSNRKFVFIIITLITLILQLTFARIGWFYRYESYLISLVIFSFIMVFADVIKLRTAPIFKYKKTLAAILIIVLLPFLGRTVLSLYKSSIAPKNIYEQQIQMAKFIHKFYQNKTIVLNDIGAVCYYNKIKLIDLNGLANIKIAKAIKEKKFNRKFLADILKKRNALIAILYNSITPFDLPSNMIKVASWKIKNNVICWKDKVFFYAIGKNNYQILKLHLKNFEKKLPEDIIVKYYFANKLY